VLHFSPYSGKLRVTEVILGEKATCVYATTTVRCPFQYDVYIACCSIGEHILVMAGKGRRILAFLLDIDDGDLCTSIIHITKLKVKGKTTWFAWPYLCSISDTRALLYFHWQDGVWYWDLEDRSLVMRATTIDMPSGRCFETVPIRIPGGKLFVAGAFPYSRNITLITPDERLTCTKIGDIPGVARDATSAVLIGQRFVVSFGGWNNNYAHLDDLWIFDLQCCKVSTVEKKGSWPPRGELNILVVQDGILYLIGKSINCIPISTLALLITSPGFRSTFCHELGIPLQLEQRFRLGSFRYVVQPIL